MRGLNSIVEYNHKNSPLLQHAGLMLTIRFQISLSHLHQIPLISPPASSLQAELSTQPKHNSRPCTLTSVITHPLSSTSTSSSSVSLGPSLRSSTAGLPTPSTGFL